MSQIENNKIGPGWRRWSGKKLDKLVNQLHSPDIQVVTRTAAELTRYARAFPAKSIPRIYEYFLDPAHKQIQHYLAGALRGSFTVERFQPTLELLWHPDKEVRNNANKILGFGLRLKEVKLDNAVLDQLLDYLQDPDETVRERIGRIIALSFNRDRYRLEAGWEPLSEAQVNRVIALAEKAERPVKRSLLAVLNSPAEAYQPAIPLLISSLRDVDPDIVIAALQSLLGMGPDTAYQAKNNLFSLLNTHSIERVRQQAAYTFGRIERADHDIIEALLEATWNRDSGVKRSAIGALGELIRQNKNPDVIERLLELTFDTEARVREKAAYHLGELDLRDTLIINRLVALLRDRDVTVRGQAIDGLGKIGNKSHIPLFKKFINSEPVYDIYDSNLALKAKNAFEQVWDKDG